MAYRSMLHKRILPAAAAAAAGAAIRRSAAGSRLFQARQQQGNGRQHSSSSSISEFLGADFRRARGNDLKREMEQLLQTAEENSKRWSQEWEELDKLRRLDLEEIEKSRESTAKILDVATGVSAGFFLVGIASYNNLI